MPRPQELSVALGNLVVFGVLVFSSVGATRAIPRMDLLASENGKARHSGQGPFGPE